MKISTKVFIVTTLVAAAVAFLLSRSKNVFLGHSKSIEAEMQLSKIKSDMQANREKLGIIWSLLFEACAKETGLVHSKGFYQLMTDGLRRRQQKPLDFDRQSVDVADFVDPWGRPYKIRIKMDAGLKVAIPHSAKIWSSGKDGVDREGRGDDIAVDIKFVWSEEANSGNEVLY